MNITCVSKTVTWMDNAAYWSPHDFENTKLIYVAKNFEYFELKNTLQPIHYK